MNVKRSQLRILNFVILAASGTLLFQNCSKINFGATSSGDEKTVIAAIPVIPGDEGGEQACYPVIDEQVDEHHPASAIICALGNCSGGSSHSHSEFNGKVELSSGSSTVNAIPVIPGDEGGDSTLMCKKYLPHEDNQCRDSDYDSHGHYSSKKPPKTPTTDTNYELVQCVAVCYTPAGHSGVKITLFKGVEYLELLADGQVHNGYKLGACDCDNNGASDELNCEDLVSLPEKYSYNDMDDHDEDHDSEIAHHEHKHKHKKKHKRHGHDRS